MSVPGPRAFLFDLDGTLLDTIGDLADSMNAALAAEGAPPHPEDAYFRFVGDGVVALVRRAAPPEMRDDESVGRLVVRMRQEYGRRWNARTRPYPGIPEMLAAISNRGLPMAVLSNKPDDFTQLTVREFLGGHEWAVVRGAKEGMPKKPDPTAAIHIADRLDIPAADFFYLGDTNTDMRTAVRAGMYPVGVTWGFRPREELVEAGAKLLLDAPADLLRHL